jgi:hypothetical protein
MVDDPIAVLRRARQEAIDITDKVSGRALYRILKNAEEDLARRLENHRQLRPMPGGSFTRTQMEVTLRQIRTVMRTVVDKLGVVIPDAAEGAAAEASDGVAEYLSASEQKYRGVNQPLALDEAAMSDAAIAGARASVSRRLMVEHPDGAGGGILQRYGFSVVDRFEKQLQVAVVTKKPFAEVRSAFVDESPFLQQAPQSWAERITRTEMMGAYNRGGHEAMKTAQEELGDMVRILVATFDDRTGADSYNVHGEIRRMGEPFEYVTGDGERVQFMTPPNRPNDREVVVAHRLSWGIPDAFRPKSDAEVEARYRREKAKYHGRPRQMSTVKLPLR